MKKGDILKRGDTEWEVLGVEADGRIFCRSGNKNTAWLTTHFEPEGQVTPEESVVCVCHDRGEGFSHDQETGLYVHAVCRKPTALHLEGMAAKAGAWQA